MAEPRLPRHIKTLDSMRAISSLAVFASHIVQIFWLPLVGVHTPIYQVNSLLSETAVIVFFLLSGYLIAMSIRKNIVTNSYFMLSDFAAARAARIYPPLIFAILVSLGVFYLIKLASLAGVSTPLQNPSDLYSARDLIALKPSEIARSLLMIGGLLEINGPLWSLYIEVPLYAAAGVAAMALKGRGQIGRACAIIVFAALVWFIVERNYTYYAVWWLIGAIFFLYQIIRNCLVWFAGSVLGIAVLYLSPATPTVEVVRLCAMFAISYAMFFVWTWESWWLEEISGISYKLYLIHFPLLILGYSVFVSLHSAEPPSLESRLLATLLSFLTAFTVAWFVGAYVENTKRFQRLIFALARFPFRNLTAGM